MDKLVTILITGSSYDLYAQRVDPATGLLGESIRLSYLRDDELSKLFDLPKEDD